MTSENLRLYESFSAPHDYVAILQEIPAGTKAFRIDPTNATGPAYLRGLSLIQGDIVSQIPLNSCICSRDAKCVFVDADEIVLDCIGHDPQLVFRREVHSHAYLQFCISCEQGRYAEVFWDNGKGFSQERSGRFAL